MRPAGVAQARVVLTPFQSCSDGATPAWRDPPDSEY